MFSTERQLCWHPQEKSCTNGCWLDTYRRHAGWCGECGRRVEDVMVSMGGGGGGGGACKERGKTNTILVPIGWQNSSRQCSWLTANGNSFHGIPDRLASIWTDDELCHAGVVCDGCCNHHTLSLCTWLTSQRHRWYSWRTVGSHSTLDTLTHVLRGTCMHACMFVCMYVCICVHFLVCATSMLIYNH